MLNIRANKIGMGLYRILYHLFTHTKNVGLQARLVSNHKVIKYRRRRVREQQGALFELWEHFAAKEQSPEELLRKAARHIRIVE